MKSENSVKHAVFTTALVLSNFLLLSAAYAQSASGPVGPPKVSQPNPPIINIPPPTIRVSIPINPPNIPTPMPDPKIPIVMPLIPTDLTQPIESPSAPRLVESPNALAGIEVLNESKLPKQGQAQDPEGIIVKYKAGSHYEMTSSTTAKLVDGDFLVSVRRPTRLAEISMKLADAFFSSDSDVELRCDDDSARIINLSGLNQKVIVKVKDAVLPGASARIYSIKPGYELLLADHRLHRAELRPHDGYARRACKTLENGQMAISEISVESVLRESALIANLQQHASGVKEKRILADMSKMAAVLNYVNGTAAYEAEPKASLEVNYKVNDGTGK